MVLIRSGLNYKTSADAPPNKALQPTPESAPAPSAARFPAGAAELGRYTFKER